MKNVKAFALASLLLTSALAAPTANAAPTPAPAASTPRLADPCIPALGPGDFYDPTVVTPQKFRTPDTPCTPVK